MIVIDQTLALQIYGKNAVRRAVKKGHVTPSGVDYALTFDGVCSLPMHGDALANILKQAQSDDDHRAQP